MAIINVGHTSMQVSIVEMNKDQLKILSHAHDESIGAFHRVLIRHILANFNLKLTMSDGNVTKVRHPNLVSLIGGNPESRALIFEFVPNGSRQTFLTGGNNSRMKLSWQDHIRIASEICSALIFLHSVPPHGIACGDLKPQNILLDSNLVSKLADFGISCELYKTDDTFTPLHETKIPKFTPAYYAPEFFSSDGLTPRGDVYSFGIILLQLVTGRDPQKIRYFVEETCKTSKFNNEVDDSAGNWPISEAEKLALLGLRCCHPLAMNPVTEY